MIVLKQHTTFRTQNDMKSHYTAQQISCHIHKVECVELLYKIRGKRNNQNCLKLLYSLHFLV